MPKIMDQAATVLCAHGAQVQASPSITRVSMGGMAPLAKDDTFVVAGCPLNVGGSPSPCTEVQWLTATTRVRAEGKELLLDSSTGLCKGAAPQGAPSVVVTQQRVEAQ